MTPITCTKCNLDFKATKYLKAHWKNIHNEKLYCPVQGGYDKYINKCILGCKISYWYKKDLIVHLDSEHGVVITKEEWKFVSYEEFREWLHQTMIKENCNLVYENSAIAKKDRTLIYLNCSYSICHKKYKKRVKKNTHKLNFSCTNHMIVSIWPDDSTTVEYWKDHYGHLQDLTCITLAQLRSAFEFQERVKLRKEHEALRLKRIKTQKFIKLATAVKRNLIKAVLNLQYLNEKQLDIIYKKSQYFKRIVKEIVINRSIGANHDFARLRKKKESSTGNKKRKSKKVFITKNNFEILNEFLIFRPQ